MEKSYLKLKLPTEIIRSKMSSTPIKAPEVHIDFVEN